MPILLFKASSESLPEALWPCGILFKAGLRVGAQAIVPPLEGFLQGKWENGKGSNWEQ